MKKFIKTISLVLALVFVLSMALTGCGSKAGDDSDLKTSITVWATPLCGDFEEVFNEQFLPKFQEAYPGVDVELEMLTWEGVADKLQMALTTNTTPDVYIDGTARTAALPALGVLEPVDDIMAAYDDWYESVTSIGVVDGTHYLVPATTIAASRLDINVDLAKELGVYDMLPEDKMSWDIRDMYNFIEAAAKAGADKDVAGTYLYAGSSTSDDILYSLMLSNGGQIIDFDTMTCVANSPECVEVVQVLGDIVKNGYAMPGATMLTGGDANTPFMNGKYVLSLNMAASAMMGGMQDMVNEGYREKVDECANYGVPHAEGMDMVCTSWGANCFAVFTNDGDQDKITASKELVKMFVGDNDISSAIWQGSPTYTPVRDCGITYSNDDKTIEAAVNEHAQWSGQYANSSFGMLESYWSEIRNYFYPELQAVYSGEKTAQEAMDSFVANVNTVLAANK